MTFNLKKTIHALAATALTATVSVAAPAQEPSETGDSGIRLRAIAVNLSNVGRPGQTPIDIGVERWSTDEEMAAFKTALVEDADNLARQLQKMPRIGFIRPSSGGLGWDVRYARRTELPGGGYRILVATDRPLSFREAANQPRLAQYDVTVAEVRVDKDGKGEGKLVPAAKVTFNEQQRELEVENYASEPLGLTQVVVESVKSDKSPARQKEE
jgi:hypothetical protein